MYGHNSKLCGYYTTEGGVMDNIPMIKGKQLDGFALALGLKRKKRFIFFKESDNSLRKRCCCRVCQITGGVLSVLGAKVVK